MRGHRIQIKMKERRDNGCADHRALPQAAIDWGAASGDGLQNALSDFVVPCGEFLQCVLCCHYCRQEHATVARTLEHSQVACSFWSGAAIDEYGMGSMSQFPCAGGL
jgi:hypothetical protein